MKQDVIKAIALKFQERVKAEQGVDYTLEYCMALTRAFIAVSEEVTKPNDWWQP